MADVGTFTHLSSKVPLISFPNRQLVDARVVELFAGVGGFRLGLDAAGWETIWSSQWEPGNKAQYASRCYTEKFGSENHSNQDIATVPASHIPPHDLLVGGFPCQDYSVATTKAEGIHGKKGVLWWEIHRIASAHRPPYILLENVDRLLRSPTAQRGRDFGIILGCLKSLGYVVEWRVVNAADYGAAQRRRRVFILATRADLPHAANLLGLGDRRDYLQRVGFFARVFPVVREAVRPVAAPPPALKLPRDLQTVSDNFEFRFENAGVMADGHVWTAHVRPQPEPFVALRAVLERGADKSFYVPRKDIARWRYLKGAKAEPRTAANGHRYHYTEGAIPFPDDLDRPARTILTSEGGLSPSRFKHLIRDPWTRRLRILTPPEVERLNQFPQDWTNTGMPTGWRYFCMGNALVVGLVERIGGELLRVFRQPARSTAATARVHQTL